MAGQRIFFAAALFLATLTCASAENTANPLAGRSIFDTPRFTIALPAQFSEVHRNDQQQPFFYFSDSVSDPHSKRAITIMFLEGNEFTNGHPGSLLETMNYALSQQHTNFHVSKTYFLDPTGKLLCSKWSGEAKGNSLAGLGCEVRTPSGFALLHAMDAASSFADDEPAFRAAMLSFRVKN